MNEKLEEKKANRFRFLNALYEKTGGNEFAHLNMWEIATELGIAKHEADLIVQYLKGEHLLKIVAMGGYIAITHFGVLEVEGALSEPDEPTQYFPPVVNILSIGSVHGSTIQQAGAGSTLSATIRSDEIQMVREIATTLRNSITDLSQVTGRGPELQAMVTTLESQISMPSPNRTIVGEALKSVRTVLEGAGGTVAGEQILALIKSWLG